MKKILVLVLLVIGLGTALAGDEADRMKFADGLYARGMYELASREYEKLLNDFPESSGIDTVRFRLGECYRNLGMDEKAEKYFRDLYVKNRDSKYRARAGFRRAEIHRKAGDAENAITLYKLLLEGEEPDEIKAASAYYLGELYDQQKRDKEALQMYRSVSTDYPDSDFCAYALLKQGKIYAKDRKKVDSAIKTFVAVADKPPTPRMGAEALFQAAELYHLRGKHAESVELYGKLLSKYPDDERSIEARARAAWSLYHAELYREALASVDGGIKKDRKDLPEGERDARHAEWLYLKANCERQLLRNDDAVETYAQLLKDHPSSQFTLSARYEKALASYRSGNYEEAVKEAGSIVIPPAEDNRSEELRKDVYWLLAECYAALNKQDEAVQYYKLIARDFPRSDVACDAIYRLAYHLRDRSEYLEASRQFLAVANDFKKSELAPRALYASGLCLAEEGRYDEAVRDWSNLLRLYPQDQLVEEAMYRKGISEIKLERGDTALGTFARLLGEFPKSVYRGEAYYWRGVLFMDSERYRDAEVEFRAALDCGLPKDIQREARFCLAVVLYKTDKMEEAAEIFYSMLETPVAEKLTPDLMEWLSGYWYDKKEYKKAIVSANVLSERFLDKEWQQAGCALKGRALLAAGRVEEAEKAFNSVLAIDTGTDYVPESALRLAEMQLARGSNDAAVDNFTTAARLAGDDLPEVRARAYFGLAKAAQTSGDQEGAVKYYMSVAILYDEPGLVAECLYEAAHIFRELGRDDDAIKAERELKERYPQSPYAKRLEQPEKTEQ